MTDLPIQSKDVLLGPDERIDKVNLDIRLIQNKNGLTFGTDAYLLSAFVRPSARARAVDLGSGTGIISLLLLASAKVKTVTAVEVQESFADLIARNAAINGFSERLFPLRADVRELTPATLGFEADLVISNPPYMRCDTGRRNQHDEKYIARHEVMGGILDFCLAAGRLLKHGGRFACVFRPDRLSELFYAMRSASLEPKRMTFVHADEESEPSAVLIEAVKGGAPSLRVSPPLLLYQKRGEGDNARILTPTAQRIYDECKFPYKAENNFN